MTFVSVVLSIILSPFLFLLIGGIFDICFKIFNSLWVSVIITFFVILLVGAVVKSIFSRKINPKQISVLFIKTVIDGIMTFLVLGLGIFLSWPFGSFDNYVLSTTSEGDIFLRLLIKFIITIPFLAAIYFSYYWYTDRTIKSHILSFCTISLAGLIIGGIISVLFWGLLHVL